MSRLAPVGAGLFAFKDLRLSTVSEQKPKENRPHLFKKGQSGNPGGRPKVAMAWKERCRKFLEEDGGWEQLVKIAKGQVPLTDPMPALKLMAEYAYGKPQQHVDVTSQGEQIKAYVGVDLDRV